LKDQTFYSQNTQKIHVLEVVLSYFSDFIVRKISETQYRIFEFL